ncbi:ArpD ABC-type protease/lipase transport system, ATPase and permease components [Oxalobacteraceae bacterium]
MSTMNAINTISETQSTSAASLAHPAWAPASEAKQKYKNKPASAQHNSLLHMLREFKTELIWVVVFSFIANLLTLTPTLYMLQVFDRVMQSQNEFTLMVLTGILVLFLLVMAFAEFIRSRLLVRAGMRFDELMNRRVFAASFDAHTAHSSRDGLQVFNELTRFRQFVTGSGIIALSDLPWSVIYVGVLFLMHPMLGWFASAFTLFLAAQAWLTHRISTTVLDDAVKREADNHQWLASKLRNADTVEAMGMLHSLRRQWRHRYQQWVHVQEDAQHKQSSMAAVAKFTQYTQQSLILSVGAWLVIHGELSIGAMVASNLLMGNALRPIGTLVKTWKEFAHARHALHEVTDLLDHHSPVTADHRADTIQGKITLKQLSAYKPRVEARIIDTTSAHDHSKRLLHELDVEFNNGEIVAIIGPSGAGKSTLLRCIIGIWPVTTGSVMLDGVAIEHWSRNELGARIGYLPQDPELFNGTVAENICRFSNNEQAFDSAAIVEAAQRADIHQMILRLPNGYDTSIGVAGQLLSAGQRQRLALARALYNSPDIILLDEPNANLDDAGEAALAKSLCDLKAMGKTVFMVLHQRSLLQLADRVLVLEQGRIKAFGKFEISSTTVS